MNKRILILFVLLVSVGILCGFETMRQSGAIEETALKLNSRGIEIPAVVNFPNGDQTALPLVVLVHGHGGSKDENIGFPAIAAELAKRGIASIRMDFPGCGDSIEDFTKNHMSNMKEDVLSATEYMTKTYNIDPEKIGIFGYSMGGRIALELLAEEAYPFAAVGLLAPAADTDDLKNLFGGKDGWDSLKKTANISSDGYAPFTTIYGQDQKLSKEWFSDLEKYTADALITAAAEKYAGPSIVIYAVNDEAVSPEVSIAVAGKLAADIVAVPEDGHSYGFYSDKKEILELVSDSAADFFEKKLK